jgi:hypothetical protein
MGASHTKDLARAGVQVKSVECDGVAIGLAKVADLDTLGFAGLC